MRIGKAHKEMRWPALPTSAQHRMSLIPPLNEPEWLDEPACSASQRPVGVDEPGAR